MHPERLKALRELSSLLKEKKDVPQELWGMAGMKVGARLKDVEKEIVAMKKNVSKDIKSQMMEKQQTMLEDEAKRHGVTVEELVGKTQEEREFNMQLKRNRERARDGDRAKKEVQRQTDLGEYDMAVDYV
ncbi:hypothetical protein C3747_161g133c [Trypanosoma cruzi]|uniref:Uncharacterized protein n=2 Tax=Trypanosoma cruzi TaxID=5693 RepID=Q4DLX2_TRYCC|nr:hypothetical protein, conserved [Trypanosoma cruzi]EAN93532.1 hypothetical protein, conserved [Trypanosoma cruzi]PWV04112.1 hypothetical protein C3747_161g133c [Trypanosoma cruzi]RNC50248.1 hypothetical protein TcCL_ESM12717 [Trypanosoma cruzi]|eukprot:XP_815383.1 hypothetical protein [Trypanosoma cruzi strain CL Brener]